MTTTQIAFLVLWPLLSLLAIVAVDKNKKHNGKERILLSMMFVIFPILPVLIYTVSLYRTHIFFESNSAIKDNMWLTGSDINHASSDEVSCGGSD